MKHFDITKWSDFVRGLIKDKEWVLMESHLSSGCHKCLRIVEYLQKVARMAATESKYRVPEYAIQNVLDAFVLQKPEKVHLSPSVVGRLVFDSFRQPLPEGLRSHHRLARQALYEAAGYSLDLRLERERGAAAVTLVGQIANHMEPDKPMGNLPVMLLSGKKIVANTRSNPLGEFQLEYQPSRNLRLHVEASKRSNRIEVPLSELSMDESDEGVSKSRSIRREPGKKS